MARPIKPTELKLLQGTARKCRIDPNEPKAANDMPMAPKTLGKLALEHFNVLVGRIDGMGYASSSFTEIIALAASEYEEIEICSGVIDRIGLIVESDTGVKENPAVATRRKAKQGCRMCLTELGLTPSSKSKVSSTGPKKAANPFKKMGAGNIKSAK